MGHSAPQKSEERITRDIRRASWLMVASILLSRVIGFVREWAFAQSLGATAETDVYLASFTLPDLLNFFMAAGTLSLSLIPLLAEYRAKQDSESAHRLYSAILGWLGAGMLGLIVVAEIFAEPLARWVAPGFSPEQTQLLATLLRIIFPAQFFFYVGSVGIAVQQCHGRFWFPALAPILYNSGIVLLGVGLQSQFGVAAFSIGVLAGSFVSHACLQTYGAYRLGYRFRWPSFSDAALRAEVRRYVWLTLPLIVGVSMVVADEWFTKYIASGLETRVLSYLSYARIQMRIPVAILGQAAGVASFPYLARLWSSQDFVGFSRALWREIHKLLWLAPLGALFLFQFAKPMTYFLYGGSLFTSEDLDATATATRWMSAGVCLWTLQVLLVRGLYAAQNTWMPSIWGLGVSLAAFPLYPAFADRLGYRGLALAGVCGIATYVVVLTILLLRQIANKRPIFLASSPLRTLSKFAAGMTLWGVTLFCFWQLGQAVQSFSIFQFTRVTALTELSLAVAAWGLCFFFANHFHFRRTPTGSLL